MAEETKAAASFDQSANHNTTKSADAKSATAATPQSADDVKGASDTPPQETPNQDKPKSDATKNASGEDTLSTLQAAAQGLLFMSESDEPMTPFVWDDAKTKGATDAIDALIAITGADKNAVKTRTVADFFHPMTRVEDWMGDDEKATAAQWVAFVDTLGKTITGAQAFRIEGDPTIDAYVVGKDVAGRWAGVSTRLVET